MRTGGIAWAVGVVTSVGLVVKPAAAEVTEPDGRVVPQPLSYDIQPDVVACCGVEEDGSNISLEALFQSRGETIQWEADATVEPQLFAPGCGLRGSLVLRGDGCRVDFGWYNVDLNDPNPPPVNLVYPLVSTADISDWFTANGYPPNNANAFHPAVGEPPVQGAVIGDIRTDPHYLGGLIAFASLGNDVDGVCTQSHYTEPRLNQMSIYGEPWIMALVYPSTVATNSFYVAFEDLPTDPDNFTKLTPEGYQNEGDFNDQVYFVEGVTCEGGGQVCLTSAEGICALGMTVCGADGFVQCAGQNQPELEVCDRLDNDCNGLVDDGDLCPPGEVCDRGICRGSCTSAEMECPGGLACRGDTGRCEDPSCADVVCEPGQVCEAGNCVDGCAMVICPIGQICLIGECVDPCAGRQPDGPNACPAGTVCEFGVCMDSCACRMCGAGMECEVASGECVPEGCSGVSCDPGFVCQGGSCVDACSNVLCPGTLACEAGMCRPPGSGTGGAPGTGGTPGTAGAAGTGGTGGLGGVPTGAGGMPGSAGSVTGLGGSPSSAGAPASGMGGAGGGADGGAGVADGGVVCTPGEQRACACPGGGEGVQVCSDDGTRLEQCTPCPDGDEPGDTARTGSSSSGCGCRTAPSRSRPVGLLMLLAVAVVSLGRRRRCTLRS